MARTHTIVDDDIDVSVSITVDADDVGAQRITQVTLAARNGGGVRAEHLALLGQFGLTVPSPSVGRRSSGRSEHSVDDGGGESTSVTRKGHPRQIHPRPDDAVVADMYNTGTKVADIAAAFGVPKTTAAHWVRRLHRAGLIEYRHPPTSKSRTNYRRCPDNFATVYKQQGGDITAIHLAYPDVPRHTVYSWAVTARRRGDVK